MNMYEGKVYMDQALWTIKHNPWPLSSGGLHLSRKGRPGINKEAYHNKLEMKTNEYVLEYVSVPRTEFQKPKEGRNPPLDLVTYFSSNFSFLPWICFSQGQL